MRFIGNNHALHFGGVTFINRVTLVKLVEDEMGRLGKSPAETMDVARLIADVVDQVEEELRDELRQKHYHHDLHMPLPAE